MKSGRLTRQLVLEEAQRTSDGAGGFNETWIALGPLWAEVEALSGRERSGEELWLSSFPYRITVRATPFEAPSRPRPGQRFREGARLFRIKAVAERDLEARYLTCFATEEIVA